MNVRFYPSLSLLFLFLLFGCSTAYEAKPVPMKMPSAFENRQSIGATQIGARAFPDTKEAEDFFGFNITGAGLLPVQIVIDNQGSHAYEIKSSQTFLVSKDGSLWSILDRKTVYERSSKFSESKAMMKEGAYKGMLGAAAGSVIGAAIGVISGESVAKSTGKGAAVGAAAGVVIGGVGGYGSNEPMNRIKEDLNKKTLENKPIPVNELTYGFLFFPIEAKTAQQLRLQLKDMKSQEVHTLTLPL
ncbi:MAG: hypothetical protein HQL72_14755 [Magnetococcales bacterium]|nr:hypothetical protein [Magnetococcales bacterium]